MPGDDLLFQRLSVSTIGAVWFHGRVRDGIGWVTDAMVTKQWCPCTIIDVFEMLSGWRIVLADGPIQATLIQGCH